MRYRITETCTYAVEADTPEQAEEIFLERCPALPSGDDSPITLQGVTEREVELIQPGLWAAVS